MTKRQFQMAWKLANTEAYSTDGVDDSMLYGCGLPEFQPITVPMGAVVRFLRYQCFMLNGNVAPDELAEATAVLTGRGSKVQIEMSNSEIIRALGAMAGARIADVPCPELEPSQIRGNPGND